MIDNIKTQTLQELGLGYKAIFKKYPYEQWNLQPVHLQTRRKHPRQRFC